MGEYIVEDNYFHCDINDADYPVLDHSRDAGIDKFCVKVSITDYDIRNPKWLAMESRRTVDKTPEYSQPCPIQKQTD
jgi:hypothetical protein